jgi:hypothetical protein
MPNGTSPYGPGVDEVGLPTGESNMAGFAGLEGGGEAFDFGAVFSQVKSWLVKNDDKIIQVVVPWLKKQLRSSGFSAEAFDLPNSTPITAMVLPSQVGRLSPAARKLTKEDLLALGGWGVARKLPSQLGLTTKDIQTIRDVFTPRLVSGAAMLDEEPEAWSISCCSCTPCCCAAAVTRPVRLVA